MSDDVYIYRDLYREAVSANDFVKHNTILSLINRIEWLISKKLEVNPSHNIKDLEQVIEILRGIND
jgi:hypothetical protein